MTRLPSFDLAGEVALVTGASSGIGRHLAELLAVAGAKVALAARRVDRLAEAAREIEAAGGECLPISLDVTRSDSVVATVAKAETDQVKSEFTRYEPGALEVRVDHVVPIGLGVLEQRL